jgi:hypothetical protein
MQSRFDTEARIAVAQAADIARELGHSEVGPDHLLLGLLANARGTAYAALTGHGLRLDAAREIVAARHVDPVDEPETADTDTDADADAASTSYDEDREALRAIGIDLDRVRDAVRSNLGQDLSDGWASRPERGRRRGRGRRHHRHHDHHHDHEGRGRRGPRSRRAEGPRFSRELRGLLRDVRRSVLRDRLDDDRDSRREVPGMSGARLLVALTRSENPVVQAVLAGATDLDALRAQAEAAVTPSAV